MLPEYSAVNSRTGNTPSAKPLVMCLENSALYLAAGNRTAYSRSFCTLRFGLDDSAKQPYRTDSTAMWRTDNLLPVKRKLVFEAPVGVI